MQTGLWRSPILATIAVFFLGIAYYCLMTPWASFLDPDAFYHAHASLLLWQHGPLMAFPWLDLTSLGTAYADQHFLFHAVEAPFVAWLGWAMGSRVTGILLAALFLAATYSCFRWIGVAYAALWTVLLAATYPLIIRIMLFKATPLAITLFVVGLAAAWKRRPVFAFAVGVLFALSHGGWAYLLGSVVLLCAGDVAFCRIVEDAAWRKAFRASPWKELLAVAAGIAIGTIAHPNFPTNLSFLWTQVVTIGLGTPYDHVLMGSEWLPTGPGALIASFALWLIALIVGLAGLLFAPKKPMDRTRMAASVAFGLPVAVLVALTLKSRRNAEYLAPALALWIPWIWSMVDPKALWTAFTDGWSAFRRGAMVGILAVALLAVFGKNLWDGYADLHTLGYRDDAYRGAMAPVSALADPGDRVFHSDWDEFPLLWNIDDRLRYVSGMDPTFLYVASSTLSDAYKNLTWGQTTSTKDQAWDLIDGRLQARFVFVEKRDHPKLLDLIKSDDRYAPLAETDDAATFEVTR